jgi:hypothetical protein
LVKQAYTLQKDAHSNSCSPENGESAQLSFAPKFVGDFFRFGRISSKISSQIGRNSPEIFEGEPQLRGFARFGREK